MLDVNGVDALAARTAGPLLRPDEPGYAGECAGFNLAVTHTPDLVLGATGMLGSVNTCDPNRPLSSSAKYSAISRSVANGKCGPCCSTAATGNTTGVERSTPSKPVVFRSCQFT